MAKIKEENQDTEKLILIVEYLKSKKYPAGINKMMSDMYKGQFKTLPEWVSIDNKINGRRVI